MNLYSLICRRETPHTIFTTHKKFRPDTGTSSGDVGFTMRNRRVSYKPQKNHSTRLILYHFQVEECDAGVRDTLLVNGDATGAVRLPIARKCAAPAADAGIHHPLLISA